MANKLRDIFSPSPDQMREMDEFVARCRAEALEHRKQIRLEREDDAASNAPLYQAVPFSGFIGDCEDCDHYLDPKTAVVTGGDCTKHRRGCGYGFTCKDNTSGHNNGWVEFEKIKKGDNK